MTNILDGKKLASEICNELAKKVKKMHTPPMLTAIMVGDDPASKIYIKLKQAAANRIGIKTNIVHLPVKTSQADLIKCIETLNTDSDVHGILVQLPLPSHIDVKTIIQTIDPRKDVDGCHPLNVGKATNGDWLSAPCTPRGIMKLLEHSGVTLRGASALVIGTSAIVGRPTAIMLSKADCTVTMANSKTKNLYELCRQSEVLVVAAGRPHMIPGDWIRRDTTVIDVGINRVNDKLIVGDVNYQEALGRAKAITPVPGGVGPMTVACLMESTVFLAEALMMPFV